MEPQLSGPEHFDDEPAPVKAPKSTTGRKSAVPSSETTNGAPAGPASGAKRRRDASSDPDGHSKSTAATAPVPTTVSKPANGERASSKDAASADALAPPPPSTADDDSSSGAGGKPSPAKRTKPRADERAATTSSGTTVQADEVPLPTGHPVTARGKPRGKKNGGASKDDAAASSLATLASAADATPAEERTDTRHSGRKLSREARMLEMDLAQTSGTTGVIRALSIFATAMNTAFTSPTVRERYEPAMRAMLTQVAKDQGYTGDIQSGGYTFGAKLDIQVESNGRKMTTDGHATQPKRAPAPKPAPTTAATSKKKAAKTPARRGRVSASAANENEGAGDEESATPSDAGEERADDAPAVPVDSKAHVRATKATAPRATLPEKNAEAPRGKTARAGAAKTAAKKTTKGEDGDAMDDASPAPSASPRAPTRAESAPTEELSPVPDERAGGDDDTRVPAAQASQAAEGGDAHDEVET